MKKRTVAVLCAAAAVLGVIIGGTMAYLQHSAAVVNTFTAGKIGITLTESNTKPDGNGGAMREYIMAPGTDLPKDPKVTVDADSEDCYLFVKVTANRITGKPGQQTPIQWEIDEDWKQVTGVELGAGESLYYHVYHKGDKLEYSVLEGDKVTVPDTVTKTQLAGYKDAKPELAFKAYAIQEDWLTDENGNEITDPAAIWALVKDAQPTATQNA